MPIAALLIGLALLVLTIPFVVGPIINEKREKKFLTDEPEEEETEMRYQQILTVLRELDFDHQLDVVSDEDYPVLRGQLLLEAAQARTAEALDVQIETAVLARRRAISMELRGEIGQNCPQCSYQIEPDDKFCAGCGLKLTTAVPQETAT